MSDPDSPDMVYCRDCGAEIRAQAEICPECGIRQKDPPSTTSDGSEKDPGLAAVGSFVIPGVGQVYNGEILKGIIGGVLFFAFALTGIGLIIAVPLWVWLIYDAYKTADAAGNSPAGQSSGQSFSQKEAEQVDETVLEVLEWYKSQTTGAGLVEETKRQYRRATSMDDLSDRQLERLATALEEYQTEHGETEELQRVHAIVEDERSQRTSEEQETS